MKPKKHKMTDHRWLEMMGKRMKDELEKQIYRDMGINFRKLIADQKALTKLRAK